MGIGKLLGKEEPFADSFSLFCHATQKPGNSIHFGDM